MAFFRRKKTKEQGLLHEQQQLLRTEGEDERYRYLTTLGEGSFGTVHRCFDSYLNRVTARKSLLDISRAESAHLQALIREARLISYLEHPGVISIYDGLLGDDGLFCYTMKEIEGQSLEDLLNSYEDREQPFPLSQCVNIFTKICETLDYVHDKGVIHLDLKPQNIMIGTYGEVSIVDWGTARLYDPKKYLAYLEPFGVEQGQLSMNPQSEKVEGTPPYMSPEQLQRQNPNLGPGSDIFSAGVVLYLMLSGRFPFSIQDLGTYFQELLNKTPELLHQQRGDIPLRLSQICAKMLEKEPSQRYQSFHEILEDLQDYSNAGQSFDLRTYPPNTVIFEMGAQGEYAFQILEGVVEIYVDIDGKPKVVATRGQGEVVGELAVLFKGRRTASVRTLTKTVVKIMTEETIEEELEKLDPWIGQMLLSLSKKVLEYHEATVEAERTGISGSWQNPFSSD